VDLSRIPPRTDTLTDSPRRALAFTKTMRQIPALRAACQRSGLTLSTLGRGTGEEVDDPERVLVQYDIVFATARSAIEALCAGAAVIVCDGRGLAELVTTENYDRLRALNFGLRSLTRELTADAISGEIDQYDKKDAEAVANRVRSDADFEG